MDSDSPKFPAWLRKSIWNSALSLLTLAIVVLFWDKYILAIALLIVVSFLMIWNEQSWDAVVLYGIVLILGPWAEAVAIYFGAWSYSVPQFIGISAWLPFVWGNAAISVSRMIKTISCVRRKF